MPIAKPKSNILVPVDDFVKERIIAEPDDGVVTTNVIGSPDWFDMSKSSTLIVMLAERLSETKSQGANVELGKEDWARTLYPTKALCRFITRSVRLPALML